MELNIRCMYESDIIKIKQLFKTQGWEKSVTILQQYFEEQSEGKRQVFVAVFGIDVLAYATLLPNDINGPFANTNIPSIFDFNVFKKYQKQGIR